MISPLFEVVDRNDFPRWLKRHGMLDPVVEVGVLFGEYSEWFLNEWPGTLHMVDPWVQQDSGLYLDGCNGVHMPLAYERTLRTVKRFKERAVIHRMFSQDAAGQFAIESLSAVYLDGNHGYKAVRDDISAWLPTIKSGGVLAGHDHYSRHDEWQDCGVKEAVSDFARENRLMVHLTPCTSWFILKP